MEEEIVLRAFSSTPRLQKLCRLFKYQLDSLDDLRDMQVMLRHFQRHDELVRVFVEEMQRVHTFWQPAPPSPFPWEKKRRKKKPASSKKPAEVLSAQPEQDHGEQETPA